jgi:hypothetical protein
MLTTYEGKPPSVQVPLLEAFAGAHVSPWYMGDMTEVGSRALLFISLRNVRKEGVTTACKVDPLGGGLGPDGQEIGARRGVVDAAGGIAHGADGNRLDQGSFGQDVKEGPDCVVGPVAIAREGLAGGIGCGGLRVGCEEGEGGKLVRREGCEHSVGYR